MSQLSLHGRAVETYFDLLGSQENSITAALGWVLKESPAFRHAFVKSILGKKAASNAEASLISLQQGGDHCGYTDIEITSPAFHLVIEAKRGWNLPNTKQLAKYCVRFPSSPNAGTAVVCLSECSRAYADNHLPQEVEGRSVHSRSWHDISALAKACVTKSRLEKQLLADLRSYLRRIVGVQDQESNLVYVVSLSRTQPDPALNFVQVVEDHGKYFHPFGEGKGWPKQPPNYLGFRYDGKLQSIHHVEDAKVIESWDGIFPQWSGNTKGPLLLYTLGPPMRPQKEVRTGNIFKNGRVYAALDLLLTSQTIAAARNQTHKRLET